MGIQTSAYPVQSRSAFTGCNKTTEHSAGLLQGAALGKQTHSSLFLLGLNVILGPNQEAAMSLITGAGQHGDLTTGR